MVSMELTIEAITSLLEHGVCSFTYHYIVELLCLQFPSTVTLKGVFHAYIWSIPITMKGLPAKQIMQVLKCIPLNTVFYMAII